MVQRKKEVRGLAVVLVFLFVAFLGGPALSGVDGELRLEELIDEALNRNPGLLASRRDWEAASARVAPAALPPNPTLGLGFGMIPEDEFGLGSAGMRTLSLSQRVPFPGKLVSRSRTASHMASAVGEAYRMKEREIVRKVKNLFWGLHVIHESIRITEETLGLLENLARVAETKYSVGKGAAGDVLKAQVELARTENSLYALDRRLMTEEAKMKAVLNMAESQERFGTPESPSLRPLRLTVTELDSLALSKRPQLLAAREMALVASSMHTTSRMDCLPDFMITLKRQNMQVGMDTWEVMFSAEVPLWALFKERRRLEETGAILASRRAAVDDAVNNARSLVASAHNRYETAKRTLETYEVAVIPQAEMSLLSARAAYENDIRDFLSLLDAERSLLKIRLEYAKAQAEFEISIAELEMVVGETLPRG